MPCEIARAAEAGGIRFWHGLAVVGASSWMRCGELTRGEEVEDDGGCADRARVERENSGAGQVFLRNNIGGSLVTLGNLGFFALDEGRGWQG